MSTYSDDQVNAFVNDESIYDKPIKSIPKPEKVKDVDLDNQLIDDIIEASDASVLDIGAFTSLNQGANDRNQMYNMYDVMCEDGSIGAVVRTCAEDATERNTDGQIVWVESSDNNVSQYITYLLDTLNVDKYVYEWAYCLCKYGDVYLRLYRESEFNDSIFGDNKKKKLEEDVKIKAYSANDKFAHYMEMVSNPARMFELTRFGKTMGYIEANVNNTLERNENTIFNTFKYKFSQDDVNIYPATEFVHGALLGDRSREDEEVDILMKGAEGADATTHSFKVRKGQSMLADTYKTWRNVSLMEDSILLNRVTKSSIVRLLNIEVGDMPKENVNKVVSRIKSLIEQKMAINKNNSMSDYTNPGPVDNTVYIPTRNNKGQVTPAQIGGDVDVKSLADLDHYISKMYGQLGVPKQYFGWTDDSTGFNGGTSLTIISSRYAKTVKRVQNSIIQMLTDAINIMLIDKGLDSYVNRFTLQMMPPTTQEEIDRIANASNRVQLVRDVMEITENILTDDLSKTKMIKSLLSGAVSNPEIIDILQDKIDELELENVPEESDSDTSAEEVKFDDSDTSSTANDDSDDRDAEFDDTGVEDTTNDFLPSPSDLDVDLSGEAEEID